MIKGTLKQFRQDSDNINAHRFVFKKSKVKLTLKPTISMKPRFILTTLTIFVLMTCSQKFCIAQDESPKWQLRFQIAPGVSYHHLLNKDGSTETDAIIGVWN